MSRDPYEPMINSVPAVEFIKTAYGLMPSQTARFDMSDPVQTALRRIKDWIAMAEADALTEDPRRANPSSREGKR